MAASSSEAAVMSSSSSSSAKGSVPQPMISAFETTPPPSWWDPLEESLRRFMASEVPIERDEALRRRERVLVELEGIFKNWVYAVCRRKGLSEVLAREAGGKLYTSGSYRLRVHEPGADIDSIGVAPKHCDRGDFFDTFKASLVALKGRIANLRSIETAVVPIMTFDMDGVNIDMLFAQLPLNTVAESLDVDDDAVLHAVDEATEKSLNGPRVTNLIYKLVEHNYESFLAVLRVARVWGKRRGLYSNKMGYLGGVNFNILVALVCQLFPAATPAYLLCKFFHIFARWKWPSPALLCRPVDRQMGFEVWNPAAHQHLRGRAAAEHARANVMPIVTPAYPAMNSAANVNPWSFKVISAEFERASDICKRIEAAAAAAESSSSQGDGASVLAAAHREWARLVEPSDFFARYDTYLAVNIVDTSPVSDDDDAAAAAAKRKAAKTPESLLEATANDDDDGDDNQAAVGIAADAFDDFKAYIASRLRKLVERLGHLPFTQVHLYPVEFDESTVPDVGKSAAYFLGLVEDESRLAEGESLVLTHVWTSFWEKDVARFRGLTDSLDLRLDHLTWSQLPDFVFEPTGPTSRARIRKERARRQRDMLKAAEATTTEPSAAPAAAPPAAPPTAAAHGTAVAAAAAAAAANQEREASQPQQQQEPAGDEATTKGQQPQAAGTDAEPAQGDAAQPGDHEGQDGGSKEEEEDEPLTFWNLPESLPKLGPVIPRWHPMAKRENRTLLSQRLAVKFVPNSPEMIEQRRQALVKERKKANLALDPAELEDANFIVQHGGNKEPTTRIALLRLALLLPDGDHDNPAVPVNDGRDLLSGPHSPRLLLRPDSGGDPAKDTDSPAYVPTQTDDDARYGEERAAAAADGAKKKRAHGDVPLAPSSDGQPAVRRRVELQPPLRERAA